MNLTNDNEVGCQQIAACGASIAAANNVSMAHLGHCEFFHLDKVAEELDATNQVNNRPSKTLMFFERCPRRLGCTILLKGSSRDELKKLKRVLQYAIFVAYHLSLTSFLFDEGAILPKVTLQPLPSVLENTSMDDTELVPSSEPILFPSTFSPMDDRTDDTSDVCLDGQLSASAGNILENLQAESLERTEEQELDDPLILIHEKKISSVHGIVKALELALKWQRPLLIVAEDVDSEALATLILYKSVLESRSLDLARTENQGCKILLL